MDKYLLKPGDQPFKFAFRLMPVSGHKPAAGGIYKLSQ